MHRKIRPRRDLRTRKARGRRAANEVCVIAPFAFQAAGSDAPAAGFIDHSNMRCETDSKDPFPDFDMHHTEERAWPTSIKKLMTSRRR